MATGAKAGGAENAGWRLAWRQWRKRQLAAKISAAGDEILAWLCWHLKRRKAATGSSRLREGERKPAAQWLSRCG